MSREVLSGYFTSFSSPEILILIGIVGVFFFHNMKETSVRKMILGESEDSPLVLSFRQFVFGLFGGLVISLIARWLHLEFHLYGEIQMVFLLTIFTLTKWSPYVNEGVNILVVFLVEVLWGNGAFILRDLPTLYFFVGISRLIQGVVIVLDHNYGFTPLLFAKGKVIRGGFRMDKTYLFPISAAFLASSGAILGQWSFFFLIYPMFSIKETFTSFSKREAVAVISGLKMICGSLILALGLLTILNEYVIYGLLVFVPLLIQGEVFFFRKIEKSRHPKFTSTTQDVVVLEVRRNSPAYLAGLRSGHRVISLNRKANPTYEQLISNLILVVTPRHLDMMVKDENNRSMNIVFDLEENHVAGIIFVPPSEILKIVDA